MGIKEWEIRHRRNIGTMESKCQLNEAKIEGKNYLDKKKDIKAGTRRTEERKKGRVEIMKKVGGEKKEMQASKEKGAERGKGDEQVEGRICQDCRRKGMVAFRGRGEEARWEKKREASKKEEAMMHSTTTLVKTDCPRWQKPGEDWSLSEEGIVENLRFSLEQLRVAGDKAAYMDLVEKLVIGPAPLRATHLEQLLGINQDLVSRASSSSSSSSSCTTKTGERRGRREKNRDGAESENSDLEDFNTGNQNTWIDLWGQFQIFSKFGDSTSDGSQITLTQSDRWLRQAKVVDGWNVTTTDTAITFRKISKGSIRLSYSSWKKFLQELSDRGDLNMMKVY